MNTEQTFDRSSPFNDARRRYSAVRALFLVAATLSFALSVGLFFSGEENEGIFVGLWVPSILALGAFMAPRDPNREEGRR
jgi:hypothetical protein